MSFIALQGSRTTETRVAVLIQPSLPGLGYPP
jgi:hypothetical protein